MGWRLLARKLPLYDRFFFRGIDGSPLRLKLMGILKSRNYMMSAHEAKLSLQQPLVSMKTTRRYRARASQRDHHIPDGRHYCVEASSASMRCISRVSRLDVSYAALKRALWIQVMRFFNTSRHNDETVETFRNKQSRPSFPSPSLSDMVSLRTRGQPYRKPTSFLSE